MAIASTTLHGKRPRLFLAAGLSLALAAGCGEEPGPPRLPVRGEVTLDGAPLSTGSITFLPTGPGATAGAPVEDGAFEVDESEGLSPGTYRVEIVSVEPTGKTAPSPDDPTATIEEVRNRIPARYNLRSELEAVVALDEEKTYRFELTSREDRPSARRLAGGGPQGRGRSGSSYSYIE